MFRNVIFIFFFQKNIEKDQILAEKLRFHVFAGSECLPLDLKTFFFFYQKETLKNYKSKSICSIALKFGQCLV